MLIIIIIIIIIIITIIIVIIITRTHYIRHKPTGLYVVFTQKLRKIDRRRTGLSTPMTSEIFQFHYEKQQWCSSMFF